MQESDKFKKNIFHSPEGYFDQLPGRIQEKIRQEEQEDNVFVLPRWSYVVAASVLILLAAGIFFYSQPDQSANTLAVEQQVEELLASVSEEELINYLQTNTEATTVEFALTEEEQQELLLQELDNYDIPLDDYEYEVEFIEEYL
ncbi:hypothetical protein [Catalinimonas niigatensis]|uniref:hypothetical protein n=1 Tax=Catalinimonas niigatensis TaxID=1397264 RepID=UPI0026665047|nr:hypothetical protein [Catalinimonas niigatensis]WPP48685.1 hypothetical protein PZB72_18605 [Catalinimonas niigatensis]